MNNKNQSIKDEIMITAKRLFYEKGYNNTTIGEIANELGISKGHISYYYKSKGELGSAIYRDYTQKIKNKVADRMYSLYGEYDLSIATAVEFRVTCRMYRDFPESMRFYKDIVGEFFTDVAKHGPIFLSDLNTRYDLDINENDGELYFIYYAWNGSVASVLIHYFEGRIKMPYDKFEDERVYLPLYIARLSTDKITYIVDKSRVVTDELELKAQPYFEII